MKWIFIFPPKKLFHNKLFGFANFLKSSSKQRFLYLQDHFWWNNLNFPKNQDERSVCSSLVWFHNFLQRRLEYGMLCQFFSWLSILPSCTLHITVSFSMKLSIGVIVSDKFCLSKCNVCCSQVCLAWTTIPLPNR